MQLNTYLFFNGQCEAAFNFYAQHLGGKIEAMLRHTGTPAEKDVLPEWRDKIIHARLTFGDNVLMASDAPPKHFHTPQGFSVSLQVEEPAQAERLFNALAQNGKITMPMQQTFWSLRFGMLVDQFGIPWMVGCTQTA